MFGLGPKVPSITVEELKKAIDAKETFILLDVRTPEEYEKARISGSTNLPLDAVSEKIGEVVSDKDKKIFVYCMSGSRSIIAVDTMKELGYTNVFDVSNGMLAWRVKRYPVEN